VEPQIMPFPEHLMERALDPFFPVGGGRSAMERAVINVTNNMPGTVYYTHDGGSRQRESAFNFSIGETDVKAPH
jgi:hypothetical protein